MCSLSVARELELLTGRQLQDLLDLLANAVKHLLTLLGRATLTTGHVAVTAVGNGLADRAGPDTDTVKGLANVDNNTHDLTILLILESVTDGGQHDVQPEFVNVNVALLFELIRPLAAVLVLGVLPLGAYASLEEVVVGLESEIGDGCDVVL